MGKLSNNKIISSAPEFIPLRKFMHLALFPLKIGEYREYKSRLAYECISASRLCLDCGDAKQAAKVAFKALSCMAFRGEGDAKLEIAAGKLIGEIIQPLAANGERKLAYRLAYAASQKIDSANLHDSLSQIEGIGLRLPF